MLVSLLFTLLLSLALVISNIMLEPRFTIVYEGSKHEFYGAIVILVAVIVGFFLAVLHNFEKRRSISKKYKAEKANLKVVNAELEGLKSKLNLKESELAKAKEELLDSLKKASTTTAAAPAPAPAPAAAPAPAVQAETEEKEPAEDPSPEQAEDAEHSE